MSDFLYYNLTGGVDLKSSKVAIGQTAKKTYWSDSKNIEIYKTGGFARMKGNVLVYAFHESDPPSILGMYEYRKGDDRYLVLNASDGKFYEYYSGSLTEKKSCLDTTKKCNYVNYLNGVVCTNGVDDPFFFEHGATPEIKQCNAIDRDGYAIRGQAIAVYKGRLWIGDGSTLYYSALGKYDDWSTAQDAGYIENFHNDSSKIIGLESYKGYLVIYKENQTYILTGSTYLDFSIIPYANKGSLSPFGIATIENYQYFFNKAVYTLEQVLTNGQVKLSAEISELIHSDFENIDNNRLNEVIALPYDDKRQVWFFIPYNNIQYIKTIWIYDYDNKAWYKRVVPQGITSACKFNDKIYIGTGEGEILQEDLGNSFNGLPIDFYWYSPFFHFGKPNNSKTIDEFFVNVDNAYDNNFEFFTRKNYVDTELDDEDSISIIESTSLIWSDGITTMNWDDLNWAEESEESERLSVSGSNKSVQICIKGNELTHDCAILGFEFRDVLIDD